MDLSEKYRPSRFEQLWQATDSPTLRVITNEIAARRLQTPALITGEPGAGKTTLARIIGRRAGCLNPDLHPHEPCLQCEGCQRLDEILWRATTWSEFGYFEIDCTEYPAAQVREMVERETAYRPWGSSSGRWVICLDEIGSRDAHYQKALLKLIENAHADIILCSVTSDGIEKPLRERCVLRPLGVPTPPQCLSALLRIAGAEGLTLADAAAHLLVTRLGGNPRRILKTLSTAQSLNCGTIGIAEIETALAMVGSRQT